MLYWQKSYIEKYFYEYVNNIQLSQKNLEKSRFIFVWMNLRNLIHMKHVLQPSLELNILLCMKELKMYGNIFVFFLYSMLFFEIQFIDFLFHYFLYFSFEFLREKKEGKLCCKSGILCLLKINPFSSFLELFWACGNIFYILCLSFTMNRFISYESYTWKSLENFPPTTTINQLIFSLTQYVLVCGMWVAAKYYKRRNNSFTFFYYFLLKNPSAL